MFVLLYFFFWPLCCLSFFDLRILITSLASAHSSYVGNAYVGHPLESIEQAKCIGLTIRQDKMTKQCK